jgi:hypothetical protein
MRDLHEDTSAVPRVLLAATSTAMLEVLQNVQRLGNDGMRLTAFYIDDETDTACIVFVRWVIQTALMLLFQVQFGHRYLN